MAGKLEPEPITTPLDDVAEWLRDVLDEAASLVEVRAPLSEVPLLSKRFSGAGNDSAGLDEPAVRKLAERLQKTCQADARTHGAAVVMYTLVALRAEGDTIGSLRVAVAGRKPAASADGSQSPLEQPGIASMLALNIKHVENLGRLMLSRLEQADTHALELIAVYKSELEKSREHALALDRQLSASFDQRLATYQKLEELSSLGLERELERKRVALREQRQEWLTEKMDLYLPFIINRIAGGGPGKGGPVMDEAIAAFLGTLKPEQIDGIIASAKLSPDQTAAFAELYASAGEAYQKRLEGRKRRQLATVAGKDSNGAEPTPRGPAL